MIKIIKSRLSKEDKKSVLKLAAGVFGALVLISGLIFGAVKLKKKKAD